MSSPLRWTLPPANASLQRSAEVLAAEFELPVVLAQILTRRGVASAEAADPFLTPQLKRLGDPGELRNIREAVTRILAAADAGLRVVLYGDYDVDGVTSLALLAEGLAHYGITAPCFLPSRMDEGYGLSPEGIARCLEEHSPELLIAVDCGTSSTKEIAGLRDRGVDVIVLDHHEPAETLPACILVNPKAGGDPALQCLCSVGVVFKVCHALLQARPRPGWDLKTSLDLVALGTVADLVPLTGENRILVRRGLVELAKSLRPGLVALRAVAGLNGGALRPSDVGFRLGPRLNAAGRLGTARAALELLQTRDRHRADVLATELQAQNAERQTVERQTVVEAEQQLLESTALGEAAIVVGARGWHPGVVGIVASRLLRTHHRPTFVIGFDEHGIGKGSGRSIEGLSLVGALRECGDLLEKYGGHDMAAGLTIREDRFPEFRAAFQRVARGLLSNEQLEPSLRLDGEIRLGAVGPEFGAALDRLQPFGMGNPQPLFFARGVTPNGPVRTMKEKHLRLLLEQRGDRNGGTAKAVWFNAPLPLPPAPWDIAFRVEPNEWNGEITWQLQIEALRSAA